MKKILITAFSLCTVLMVFVLTGCSNVPINKTLSIMWNNKETAVYDVERKISDTETLKGELTMYVEKIQQDSIDVAGNTVELGANIVNRFTSNLVMENGDTIETVTLMRNNFAPIASYIKKIVGSETVEVFGTYSNKKFSWKSTVNGTEKSDTLNVGDFAKKPYYDNNTLYYVLRAPLISKDAMSFSFNIPSWNENALTAVNSGITSSSVNVSNNFTNDAVACYGLQIVVQQKVLPQGTPIKLYYTKAPLACEGGTVQRAVVKIEEADCTYTLKSLTTVASI